MRVAVMATCLGNAMFPDVPRATVRLLRRLGVEVEVPPDQTCCGQPMVNTGYLDEAVPLVRTTVAAFAGYDAVVVGSAVYHGRWLEEARRFVTGRRSELEAMPTWFFSSGPTGGSPAQEAAVQRSCGFDTPIPRALTGVARQIQVRGHATFGGTIGEGATGMLGRWMPRGDWRDFDQVKEWAGVISDQLTAS